MRPSLRVFVNTGVQYLKTIISVIISLFSTRVILSAIGVEDYGIYTLIGGVISLLSFIVNALVTTTQRYISFYSAQHDKNKLKEVFNTSVILHIVIGVLAYLLIELLGTYLFNHILNIPIYRVQAAHKVFHVTCIMVVLSFISAPYRALLISHENITYISLIDICDAILKLIIAITIAHSNGDRLVLYSLFMCAVSLYNVVAYFIYGIIKYEECTIPNLKYYSKEYVTNLGSFAVWTIYSVGCIVGRTQGVTIIINQFFGVAINAAYGIAMQVNGALMFVSQSLLNAMNPQIVKAEGSKDRTRMLRLSEIESKFAFLLMAAVSVPCIFEMQPILELWLGNVPQHTIYFCKFILITSTIDQLTIGLGTANQAIGNIKRYSVTVNSIKLLTLIPVFIVSLRYKNPMLIMPFYAAFEFICAISRLFFLRESAGLSITGFCQRVFVKEIIPIIVLIGSSLIITLLFDFTGRFIVTFLCSVSLYLLSIYKFGLCHDEKSIIKLMLTPLIYKILRYERTA